MWPQVAVIVWAQWRTVRNHLPRLGLASVFGNALTLLWYALILCAAVSIAIAVPHMPRPLLLEWLPAVLLGFSAVWQFIPLLTLSSGWSLQLNKLQIYPVPNDALFGIEVLLRVTASPEVIILVLGGTVGLLLHPGLPFLRPLFLLLLLPLNLLLSLAIRELILHSFERNRFREIFAIVLISLAILPQWLVRSTDFDSPSHPYLLAAAHLPLSPWNSVAALATGSLSILHSLTVLFWLAATYFLARWFFVRSLRFEETPQSGSLAVVPGNKTAPRELTGGLAARLLQDPLAALVQKEIQSLLRMPRFRVAFGMACVFSVLILLPMSANSERASFNFLHHNFLSFVSLYGLLILSETLLLNLFGADRSAVALYFAAPVPLRTVLQAKNLTAAFFLIAQLCVVLAVASFAQGAVQLTEVLAAVSGFAVVALFFISIGNLTSVLLARPSDPKQAMRKAAGGKLQLWLLLCTFAMALLVGIAYVAQWAFDSPWALFASLALELAIGCIVYKVALDSAVSHAEHDREKMVDALSKGVGLTASNS